MQHSLIQAARILKKTINQGIDKNTTASNIRIHPNLFYGDCGLGIEPGITNLSPTWFAAGHEFDVSLEVYFNCS